LTCNLNINGIKLRKPERGNQYKIVVPPNGEKIISATVKPEGFSLSSSFSYGMK